MRRHNRVFPIDDGCLRREVADQKEGQSSGFDLAIARGSQIAQPTAGIRCSTVVVCYLLFFSGIFDRLARVTGFDDNTAGLGLCM